MSEAQIARVRAVYARWRRDTPVADMRADCDELFGAPVAEKIAPAVVGGVECKGVRPAGARRDGAIVYLHGGGFRLGSLVSHREIMARLAAEHPLRAALEDALAVLDRLDRFALAGDSAGGALIARLRQGKPAPAAAYLMSAWTDLTASGESYRARAALDRIHQRPMIRCYRRYSLRAKPWGACRRCLCRSASARRCSATARLSPTAHRPPGPLQAR